MKKGDLRTQDLGSGITAVQWKDKRLVTLLGSTQHINAYKAETQQISTWWNRGSEKTYYGRPLQ